MNRFLKWLAVIGAGMVVIALIAFAAGSLFGGKFSWITEWNSEGKSVVSSDAQVVDDTISLEPFDKIVIDNTSVDLFVEKGNEASFRYHVYDWEVPNVEVRNRTLYIKKPQKNSQTIIRINPEKTYYRLTVTEGEYETEITQSSGDVIIDSVNVHGSVNTSSGDIEIKNSKVSSNELKLVASSGEIEVEETESRELRITTTSGNISASKMKTGKLEIESSSGSSAVIDCVSDDINIEYTSGGSDISNSSADILNVKGSSGSVRITGCSLGSINCETTSGDIEAYNSEIDNAECEASSGNVELKLKGDEGEYDFDLKCSSGDISMNGRDEEHKFNYNHGNDKSINVTTTSGNIEIEVE